MPASQVAGSTSNAFYKYMSRWAKHHEYWRQKFKAVKVVPFEDLIGEPVRLISEICEEPIMKAACDRAGARGLNALKQVRCNCKQPAEIYMP